MADSHKGPFHGLVATYKEAADIPPSTVNDDLDMFLDSDCWGTVVELVSHYHSRFPHHFDALHAEPFRLAAAHLEFRNSQSLLSKLQECVEGHPHLEDAVKKGIEHGRAVRYAPALVPGKAA